MIRRSAARRSLTAAALVGAGVAAPLSVRAQDVGVGGPPAAHAGAGAARAVAERAQASFERRRRGLLPRTGASGGRCDVRMGRFCYWYDEQGPQGPPEPARVSTERRRLLATLDSLAPLAAADDWVAGQRVRYWLESGAADTALAAARRCGGAGWWCAALRGWALHEAGDAAAAGAAFDSALAVMPDAERCRWLDVSLLLEGEARERYRRLDCAARASVERRFWWLATPFFSRGGNDRLNEHLARHVLARLARESPTTYDARWGTDLEELLLRYGWAERWSRRDAPPGSMAAAGSSVVGHEPVPAYRWTAEPRLLDAPYDAAAADWAPRDPAARERFALRDHRHLADLRAGAALLRRGDSLLVVATFARPADPRLASPRATLVVAREGEAPLVAAFRTDSTGGVATLAAADAPQLLSIELAGDSAHAARSRFGLRPAPRAASTFALSDLLPYGPSSAADTALADAVRLAVRGDVLRAPARLGIYWEAYGLPAGRQRLETSLEVVGVRQGWLTRLWRRARGTGAASPLALRWTDVPVVATEVPAARAVVLELPDLPPGRYALRLTVRDVRTGAVARSTRELEVVR